MAYETKVILISLAETAYRVKNKEMYEIVARLVNAEGVVLPPYSERLTEEKENELDK